MTENWGGSREGSGRKRIIKKVSIFKKIGKKTNRGGRRPGAGRPVGSTRPGGDDRPPALPITIQVSIQLNRLEHLNKVWK